MLRTRRHLLQAATLWPVVGALQGAGKEFWEAKEPAAWSSEEKEVLLGQSPWARASIMRFEAEKKKPQPYQGVARPGGDVPGARPGTAPGSVPTVPIGERPPPPPTTDTGRNVTFTVLARWESAMPVRLAGGPDLPAESAKFYVIRLQGMPLMPPPKAKPGEDAANPNQEILEGVQRSSRLERKDKPAIPCEHLLTGSGDTATQLLLFFARGEDPITLSEKLVTLESRLGPFHLSVKFPLKEMMYKGALAL